MRRKVAIGMGVATLSMLMYHRYRVWRARQLAMPQPKPESLQVWESEGGGVPINPHRTAAQVSPTHPISGMSV